MGKNLDCNDVNYETLYAIKTEDKKGFMYIIRNDFTSFRDYCPESPYPVTLISTESEFSCVEYNTWRKPLYEIMTLDVENIFGSYQEAFKAFKEDFQENQKEPYYAEWRSGYFDVDDYDDCQKAVEDCIVSLGVDTLYDVLIRVFNRNTNGIVIIPMEYTSHGCQCGYRIYPNMDGRWISGYVRIAEKQFNEDLGIPLDEYIKQLEDLVNHWLEGDYYEAFIYFTDSDEYVSREDLLDKIFSDPYDQCGYIEDIWDCAELVFKEYGIVDCHIPECYIKLDNNVMEEVNQ